MEHRRLGSSGLKVPALSFGAATFGGGSEFFKAWGSTDVAGARRLVDVCLDAGVTMFDTANSYSRGASEEILGEALEGRRDDVLLATKATTPMGDGPNEGGSSRFHLVKAVEDSLRRLRSDHIDLLYMHEYDGTTSIEEVVHTLDGLVASGKVRYVAASNFSGWQLMKALAIADRRLDALRRPPGSVLARGARLRARAAAAGRRPAGRRGRLERARRLGPDRQGPPRAGAAVE